MAIAVKANRAPITPEGQLVWKG